MVANRREDGQLAFYKAAFGMGVIAPRGWYCFRAYGSGGGKLYISPQPIDTQHLFSTDWIGLTGPAIEISQFSGPSSELDVAEIIARVFPAYRAFVTGVMADDPPFSFTFGPYPGDTLTHKSKTVVEYKTPANTDGLGTRSQLKMNSSPIEGVLVSVRLPANLTGLTSAIIRQVERDAAGLPHN